MNGKGVNAAFGRKKDYQFSLRLLVKSAFTHLAMCQMKTLIVQSRASSNPHSKNKQTKKLPRAWLQKPR